MVYNQGYGMPQYPNINSFGSMPVNNSMYNQNVPMQQNYMQQSQMFGRIVNSQDVINANEVPMDGSVAVFPKNDYSEIYLKSWNRNGSIDTVIYKPVNIEENNISVSKVTLDSLNEDIISFKKEVLERFDNLEKPSSNRQNNKKVEEK